MDKEGEISIDASEFNLEEFIKNATWKEILIHLVETNKLDPWDINISDVVDKYTNFIKKVQILNLIIPANMVLAASILLRIKSDTLTFNDSNVDQDENLEDESSIIQIERPNLEPLVFRLRPVQPRKVTLNELLKALDQSIKKEVKRENYIKEINTPMQFLVNKDDIDRKIEDAYKMIKNSIDKYKLTSFRNLSKNFDTKSSILLDLFVPILFLAKENKISIYQEEFFGDIIIKYLENGDIDEQ